MSARDRNARKKQAQLGQLMIRHGGRCHWCDRPVQRDAPQGAKLRATRDHVIPRSKGGANSMANLVLACSCCNNDRGNMSVEEWIIEAGRRRACPRFQGDLWTPRLAPDEDED